MSNPRACRSAQQRPPYRWRQACQGRWNGGAPRASASWRSSSFATSAPWIGDNLHEIILGHAGEELAQFFLAYATDLIDREPWRASENASSLLLIGYLIRCFEEDLDRLGTAPLSPLLH